MNKKTLVMGATPNPQRYAFLAASMLKDHGHEVVPFGRKTGAIEGKDILNKFPEGEEGIDTVTLYLNPQNQKEYYDRILALKPKRVIFNPGTENPELEQLLEKNGISPLEACTLVLLRTGRY